MITLDDILRDLTYGEFANLNIGQFLPEEHESEPDPKSYAQLSSWINLALKAIYSEFMLSSEEIYIQQYEAVSEYILSYDYAATNTASTVPYKYITDTVASPFLDNVLKIESVYDEEGNELFLNDAGEELSLYTPTFRSLQIPWPNDFNAVAVQYRAAHAKIVYTAGMDPTGIEVVIPHPLHEALLWYIASRGYASMNTDQGAEGNDYYRKYQARVAEVHNQGLYIQTEPGNERFADNGWV